MSNFSIHWGIDRYDPTFYGEDVDLKMCVQDSQTMQGIAQHFNFAARIYTNEQATKQAWLNEVGHLAEIAVRGDTVLITQSSHGTFQETGLKRSTAICLHDDILWDFQIREVFQKFRSGVIVVWICDSCFSESNWRMVRVNAAGLPTSRHRTRFTKLPRKITITPTAGDKRKFPAIFFAYSASNAFQVSYEDESGGVFTQAIDKALRKENGLSYYQLYRRTQQIIGTEYPQSPVFDTIRAADYTGSPFLSHFKTKAE